MQEIWNTVRARLKKGAFFCITILLSLSHPTPLTAQDYNILDFGAVGDGTTLNTPAIQAAIETAHRAGGGRVIVPKGTFLTGSIVLKSNVELHLKKRGTLLGSIRPEDYLKLNRWKGLVMADQAHHIAITGKGTLDGQGDALALNIDSLFYIGQIDSANYEFKERRPKAPLRPQVIEWVDCRHAKVTGITIRRGASWVQSYWMCQDLLIDRVTVDSDTYWNNDGIDLIDCHKVRVTRCKINSSDDGICLKSYSIPGYETSFCDSIYIGNCRVRSSASAVKLGTASYGGFRNIVIEKIKVYDTFRSAIALESISKGLLDNVLVQDIVARNTGNAIFIRGGAQKTALPPGQLRNMVIRNVKCKIPDGPPDTKYAIRGPALPFFHNTFPASISGIPGSPAQNILLENIRIVYPGGGNPAYANLPLDRLATVPEAIRDYPEFSMFGELPAWGFYVRHVEGLTLRNIRIRAKHKDYRPAFVFDDVKSLHLEEVEAIGGGEKENFIFRKVEERTKGR